LVTILNDISSPTEPVSVCMIVRDEEKNLERCLRSVRDWAREIIVVDTGSKDQTFAKAKFFTDHVYRFPWTNNFADARNESLKYATSEWVLVLDADEALREESKPVLHDLFESYHCACNITVRNYMPDGLTMLAGKQPVFDGDSCYVDTTLLRVFRNIGAKFEGQIHELVEPSFAGYPLHFEPRIIIDHFGKLDPEREDAKTEIRLQMAVQYAKEHPSLQSSWNVIQEAQKAKKWELALEHTLYYIKNAERSPISVVHGLANCLVALSRFKEAEDTLEDIFALDMNHAPSLRLMGIVHASTGRVESAIAFFKAALVRKNSIAAINLGEMYMQLGKKEEAMKALRAGLLYNPKDKTVKEELEKLEKA